MPIWKKIIKVELIIILLILVLSVLAVAILLSKQEIFFFHPNFDENSYNELMVDNTFENVMITLNNGNTISGWIKYNNSKDERTPLIIYFMGNGQNASSVMQSFNVRNVFSYLDSFNILVMDYPGYGLSEGTIKNDNDFLSPTLEIYDWAIKQNYVDDNSVFVIGYSIGTGAATYLCSERIVKGLVLLAPYDEALSLYNANVNVFYGPLENLTTFKLKSKEYAKNVYNPVLIFSSTTDEVINYKFSKNLANNFINLEEFVTVEDVGHNYYVYQPNIWARIQIFLDNKK